MKIITRSEWTAQYPMSTVGTEDMDGPPFFRDKEVKGIKTFFPEESALFVELNPYFYIDRFRKSDYTQRGFGDINYNLAVAPNVEGIWSLRGLCNKSPAGQHDWVSVLVLLGNEEPPTDLLLQNLAACRELVVSRFPNATEFKSPLPGDVLSKKKDQLTNQLSEAYTQEDGVHVFELIETLSFWGYYKGRNDGVYGPVTRNAVSLLQADLKDAHLYMKRVDGTYGRYTREAFGLFLKSLR